MDALFALLEDEEERETWRLYMAQMGEGIACALGCEVTPYAQIIGLTREDTRTGDQIADDLIAKMTGEEG